MNYKKGDIVIIRFPFSDLSGIKKRPALIISNDIVNSSGDYLLVQVTSKNRNDKFSLPLSRVDFINNEEFPLKSYVRFHKIFLINKNLIISKKTTVSPGFIGLVTERINELIA